MVGAGFAGFSAAVRLAERGIRVLVLEARGRLGGRATAFPDRDTGETVDNGQHVLFGCYTETLDFLRTIGAEDNVRTQPRLELPFIDQHGRRTVLRCPRLPPPLHLLGGVLGWRGLPFRDRLSVLRVAPALATGHTDPGNITVAQWLRNHGQTPGIVTALWEPLAVAALNQPIDEAAAAPFLAVLGRMFGRDPQAASVILPSKPLDEMYAEPARRYIETRGGSVRTGALARLLTDGDSIVGVDVRGERIETNHIVAAVPWHNLPALFTTPPASLQTILGNSAAMDSSPIVTVNLWYDRVVMDDEFVGLTGRTIHWIFDKRRVFGETSSHLSIVTSAAEKVAPLGRDELIEIASREVAAALPSARGARLLHATVVREKQATFSIAPGQPPRPGVRTPVRGLCLAGDWIDTGLPSTIESAVLSGRLAADAMLSADF